MRKSGYGADDGTTFNRRKKERQGREWVKNATAGPHALAGLLSIEGGPAVRFGIVSVTDHCVENHASDNKVLSPAEPGPKREWRVLGEGRG